jgi:hypothetical protein
MFLELGLEFLEFLYGTWRVPVVHLLVVVGLTACLAPFGLLRGLQPFLLLLFSLFWLWIRRWTSTTKDELVHENVLH